MGESNDAGFDLGKPSATQKGPVILYRLEGHCAERHRPQFWECGTGKHLGDDRGSPAEAALDLVNVPPPPARTSDAGESDAAFVHRLDRGLIRFQWERDRLIALARRALTPPSTSPEAMPYEDKMRGLADGTLIPAPPFAPGDDVSVEVATGTVELLRASIPAGGTDEPVAWQGRKRKHDGSITPWQILFGDKPSATDGWSVVRPLYARPTSAQPPAQGAVEILEEAKRRYLMTEYKDQERNYRAGKAAGFRHAIAALRAASPQDAPLDAKQDASHG